MQKKRIKSECPNLGEFLVLFSITDEEWDPNFCKDFIVELFSRNVKWMLKEHPELEKIESDEVSWGRINTTWSSCLTSLRLVMFQVYFIKNIGKSEGKKPEDLLMYYNRSFGLPNKKMRNELFINTQHIKSIKGWPEFFDFIGVKRPSPKGLTTLLKNAINDSNNKRYHGEWNKEKGGRGRGRGNRGRGMGNKRIKRF